MSPYLLKQRYLKRFHSNIITPPQKHLGLLFALNTKRVTRHETKLLLE